MLDGPQPKSRPISFRYPIFTGIVDMSLSKLGSLIKVEAASVSETEETTEAAAGVEEDANRTPSAECVMGLKEERLLPTDARP
jgi:hypothetical protein